MSKRRVTMATSSSRLRSVKASMRASRRSSRVVVARSLLHHRVAKALLAKEGAGGVARLGNAVGVEQDAIALLELHVTVVVGHAAEGAHTPLCSSSVSISPVFACRKIAGG